MPWPQPREKLKVAIVGSGMAGLTTAYLLNRDLRKRYAVTIFETGNTFALDQASVSVHNKGQDIAERIDLPMRAFAEGYYENLIRMYEHLGVQFRPQRFVYNFGVASEEESGHCDSRASYFVHSSNNHRIPPIRPREVSPAVYFARIAYVAFFYLWWTICCYVFPPYPASRTNDCESLGDYVQRIMLPQQFVDLYLLPLISSVATCSHKELLGCPAIDVTDYKKKSAGKKHYTVAGVHAVQARLGEGLDSKISSTVTRVEEFNGGRVSVTWIDDNGSSQTGVFDRVIMAVAPDVVGKVYAPLQKAMSKIPSTTVTSFVTGDGIAISKAVFQEQISEARRAPKAQTIHFRTSVDLGRTESHHVHPTGAIVTTCPLQQVDLQDVLRYAQFRRALRTPESRRVVNTLFKEGGSQDLLDEKSSVWRNGDGNVWLVGGWCWDGMVLLEGCIVSAMRVAHDLDVDVPWSK